MIYLQHTVYESGERIGEVYGDHVQGESRLLAMMQPSALKLRNNERFFGFGDWNYSYTWIPFDEPKLEQLQSLIDLWQEQQPHIQRCEPPVSVCTDDMCDCYDDWTPTLKVIPMQTDERHTRGHAGPRKTAEVYADTMLIQELYTLQDGTTCSLEHDSLTMANDSPTGLRIEQQDLATLDEFVDFWRMRWQEDMHARHG